MLSESEKLTGDMPKEPAGSGVIDFCTRRIRFCKVGSMQYISHLDLQRTVGRVMVRAHLPLWFSKGFNPHPKLTFAMPLSVGSESVCELLDVRLSREMDCGEMMTALNRQLTQELCVTEVYEPATKFSDIASAIYRCQLYIPEGGEALADRINRVLNGGSLNVMKRTKSGDKETDIIPQILAARAVWYGSQSRMELNMTLSATMDSFLNPELVITALKDTCGILQGDLMAQRYTIMRERILDAAGNDFR